MKPFYSNLAHYYHHLFPLNPITAQWVRSYMTFPEGEILDVGCATGQLALALLESPGPVCSVPHVYALDPDENMLNLLQQSANEKALTPQLTLLRGGMADLNTLFHPNTFHLVLCLGNTLVHLLTLLAIQKFFQDVFSRLRSGGVFLFQIVNYTRLFTQNVWELPVLDKPEVSLTRQYRSEKTTLQFITTLTIKESGAVLTNETTLFPLQYHQVIPIIHQIGFQILATLGSFSGEAWETTSPALIMALKKP